MSNQSRSLSNMVKVALLSAIIIVLSMTPLGYVPLGVINATTVHIPVIIGSVLLGWRSGAFLGGVFGLTSFIRSIITPNLTSFVFNPFYSLGEVHGNLWSLVVTFVPRILTGIVPYFVYVLVKKLFKSESPSLMAAGFMGSMTNTILVMNFIYLFFGNQWADANGVAEDILYTTILAVIATNGIPEAILASVVTAVICATMMKILKGKGTHKNKPRKEDF